MPSSPGSDFVEFCARQDAFSLAQGGLAGELGGRLGGDGDHRTLVRLRASSTPRDASGSLG
jgi:hypothetical protein